MEELSGKGNKKCCGPEVGELGIPELEGRPLWLENKFQGVRSRGRTFIDL